jgi:virginiamycin B lyase
VTRFAGLGLFVCGGFAALVFAGCGGGGGGSTTPATPAASTSASSPTPTPTFSPYITEYDVPEVNGSAVGPAGIVTGSDGALWFVETQVPYLGRFDPVSATFQQYQLPSVSSSDTGQNQYITVGPDKALWITNTNGSIFRFDITTKTTQTFTLTANSALAGITVGSDNNLWIVDDGTNSVAQLMVNGNFHEYPLLTANAVGTEIAATGSPDNSLWVTETGVGRVARVSTTGSVTEFPMSLGSEPTGIAVGPDGNLWVGEDGSVADVGVVSTSGTILHIYSLPPYSFPQFFVVGTDGNIYLTEGNDVYLNGRVARMTLAGAVTEFVAPTGASPADITNGPDGNIWFTQTYGKLDMLTIH